MSSVPKIKYQFNILYMYKTSNYKLSPICGEIFRGVAKLMNLEICLMFSGLKSGQDSCIHLLLNYCQNFQFKAMTKSEKRV